MAGIEEIVRLSARVHDPDRYFSALLAPAAARPHLLAIAAFGGEVGHIPFAVSEPMLGRIRLEWWREAIECAGGSGGEAAGHPVADALGEAIRTLGLAVAPFAGLIEASGMLLENPPFRDEPDLFAWLDKGGGALFEAGARALGVAPGAPLSEAVVASGRAHGLAGLIGSGLDEEALRHMLPATLLSRHAGTSAAVGELADIAAAALDEAKAAAGRLPALALPAFLPLATVRASLAAARPGASPLTRLGRISRIGAAAMRGRLA